MARLLTNSWLSTACLAMTCLAVGCSSKSSNQSAGPANPATSGQQTGVPSISAPSADATVSDITATNYPDGYYTGFDGTDQFGLLLASFGGAQQYSLADPTVASIESVQVSVPTATITQLTSVLTTAGLDTTAITPIINGFGHQRSMYKVTPLKAGNTTIEITGSGPGPGGPGGPAPGGPGGSDGFSTGTTQEILLVASYTPAQYSAGKARYATAHDAADPACASCHLTGKDGAPSHALGDVNRIPDVAAEQWVTTGQLGSRTATIPHAWKFADQDEELGTVGYVRSLEATDPEQLILLEFAKLVSGCGITLNIASDGTLSATKAATGATTACLPPGFPGGPGGASTATSTGTAVSVTVGGAG